MRFRSQTASGFAVLVGGALWTFPARGQSLQQACDPYAQALGNPSCAPTEVVLFAKDTTGACLNCMFQSGCLDDVLHGDTGNECNDVGNPSACLASLECIEGVTSLGSTPALVSPPVTYDGTATIAAAPYCGAVPVLSCNNLLTTPPGVCATTIQAGFPAGWSPSEVLQHYTDDRYASGIAGRIEACGLQNLCASCFAPAPITAPTPANPPTLAGGNGNLTSFTPPTPSSLSNGYQLTGMSYTVTASSLDPITISWASSQPIVFESGGAWGVNITGGTTVSISGSGTATFVMTGGLDGQTLTQYSPSPNLLSGTTPVSWNVGPQSTLNLAVGDHVLAMGGTVVFTPSAVGDTITEDSTYTVAPGAASSGAPVPALPVPMILGLTGLLLGAGILARGRTGVAYMRKGAL